MQPFRLIVLLAGLLGWFGSDPFEGTWKLNRAKSKGTIPSDETVVIRGDGRRLEIEVDVVDSDTVRSKFVIRYSAPSNGGEGRIDEGPYSGVLVKRIGLSTLEITYLKGSEGRTTTAVIFKDGKTMTSTGKALGSSDPVAWVMLFEKQ